MTSSIESKRYGQSFAELAILSTTSFSLGKHFVVILSRWYGSVVTQLEKTGWQSQQDFCLPVSERIHEVLPDGVSQLQALDASAQRGHLTELPTRAKHHMLQLAAPNLPVFYRRFLHIEALCQLPI